MRWRNGLLTASSAIVLAGCGGGGHRAAPPPPGPRISDVIASIGRIPSRYQEPLTSAANSLAERLASCVTPKPARHARHEGHEKHRKPHHHGHDD